MALGSRTAPRRRARSLLRRASLGGSSGALVLLAVLAGCGSTLKTSPAASVSGVIAGTPADDPLDCPATVLDTLGHVLDRVYREGVSSERTTIARNLIDGSGALRSAVESASPSATRAAAQALIDAGHLSSLRVLRGTQTLADVGGPALAPVHGTLKGAGGRTIASYVTSVWSDAGFLSEGHGITEGLIALRVRGHSVGGSYRLPSGALADEGTLTRGSTKYQFSSFPGSEYPSGSPLRIYLLRSMDSTSSLCGSTSEATLINTMMHIANLIYQGEAGRRTLPQVRHVQQDRTLLEAVVHHDAAAARAEIFRLLYSHTHIVRLRVSAGGTLLSDVGGPYVLAPVTAPLKLHGRTIGSAEFSIQDDEGYLRLTDRLAGLKVLMYMNPSHPELVKNSLGPDPGTVPASGPYEYHGHTYRVFTVNAQAFPSGPLTIRVLIPIPYS
jgi:hypothetical protein